MKNFSFAIVLVFLLLNAGIGQHSISGNILTEDENPVEFANVLLLSAVDSSLVKAALCEIDGSYVIQEVEEGEYILKSVFLGFEDTNSDVFLVNSDMEMDLVMKEDRVQLDAVEIVSKRPFLEQKAGKIVVNVENSITGSSGSAVDILKKVPGVLVINNEIRLAGSGSPTIMIDGRPTQYVDITSLLKDMPGDVIKKIELISQPGAEFDAEGTGPIINIVLKKNIRLGLNGRVSLGIGHGDLTKYRGSVSLNKRNEKFNFSNQISFGKYTNRELMRIDRNVLENRYLQTNESFYLPLYGNVKSSVDYYLDDRQTLGLTIQLRGSLNESTDKNGTEITDFDQELINTLTTDNKNERSVGILSADAYYENQIDTSGQKFSLDLSTYWYDRDDNSLQTTNSLNDPVSDRRQEQLGNTKIQALKADYVKPHGDKLKFVTGLKISNAQIDNNVMADVLLESDWVLDELISNQFIYNEQIAAAYLSAEFSLSKLEFKVGLRYEHTFTQSESVTLSSTVKNEYGNVFPSASVFSPLVGPLGLSASYSYRIDRPSYRSLNPFIYYLDPFTFEQGNPFLQPEFANSYQLSLTFEKQPFLNFEYVKTTDGVEMITSQNDTTGVAFATFKNLQTKEKMGLSLFFPLEFTKDMSGYGGFRFHRNRIIAGAVNEGFDESRWNFTSFFQLNYSITEDFSFEIGGWYVGPGIEGVFFAENLYGFSGGIQYKFLDGKAKINLSAEDFISKNWTAEVDFDGFRGSLEQYWEKPIFNLNFEYSFGNNHLKKQKTRNSSISKEKNRNTSGGF